jgi:hypothetical protein
MEWIDLQLTHHNSDHLEYLLARMARLEWAGVEWAQVEWSCSPGQDMSLAAEIQVRTENNH